ncbi:MAG: hypothetical protein IPI02_12365 [Sterolibacteriaceae bacterium]|nr:hypothetical protein [Sterolibacteriaceae bacterium]
MIVAERYGLRLSVKELAELTKLTEGTVRNQISAQTFPIPTYNEGGKRWAAYQDVAAYLDQMSEQARAA